MTRTFAQVLLTCFLGLSACTYTVIQEVGPNGEVLRTHDAERISKSRLLQDMDSAVTRDDREGCIRAGRVYMALFRKEATPRLRDLLMACLLGQASETLRRDFKANPSLAYSVNGNLEEILEIELHDKQTRFSMALSGFIENGASQPRNYYRFIESLGAGLMDLARGKTRPVELKRKLTRHGRTDPAWWEESGASLLVETKTLRSFKEHE